MTDAKPPVRATDASPLDALADCWRQRAAELEAYAPAAAVAFRRAADELDERVRLAAFELLDRQAAASEAGVDPDSITRAIRRGRLVNYGTHHSPKVRRADVLAVMHRRASASEQPGSGRPLARGGKVGASSGAGDLAREALASRMGRVRGV